MRRAGVGPYHWHRNRCDLAGTLLTFLDGRLGVLGHNMGRPLHNGSGGRRTRSLQVGVAFGDMVKQTALPGPGDFRRHGMPDALSNLGSNDATKLIVIDLLLHLNRGPLLRRHVVLVLGVHLSMFVLESPRLILIRDLPWFFKSSPANRGHTTDLPMITLRYQVLVELPKVRTEQHEGVGRTGRVSILALAPAPAFGMEIGRRKLALIGKRAQTFDGLRRERLVVVVGYGRYGGVFDEWLSGGVRYIEVIETAWNMLIQSYGHQSGQWLVPAFSLIRAGMGRTVVR